MINLELRCKSQSLSVRNVHVQAARFSAQVFIKQAAAARRLSARVEIEGNCRTRTGWCQAR